MNRRPRRPVASPDPTMDAVAGVPALPVPDPVLRAVVVVPARDEAARIESCLLALAAQRGVAGREYELIVVLDGCVDATPRRVRELAGELPHLTLHALELPLSQGRGPRVASAWISPRQRLLSLLRPNGLITSTDADSVVAEDWLATQLELVERGACAIGGSIELHGAEADELPAAVRRERDRRALDRLDSVLASGTALQRMVTEHHQFSGASLGLTAQTYRDCGGLPARAAPRGRGARGRAGAAPHPDPSQHGGARAHVGAHGWTRPAGACA